MNRRETLALHRMGVMRLRARAAHQRRLAEEASHQQRDDCQCPACAIRRMLTGLPGVTVLDVSSDVEPKADDTTPKH